jgi:hypothetical protein
VDPVQNVYSFQPHSWTGKIKQQKDKNTQHILCQSH